MGSAIGRIEKEFILNAVCDAQIEMRLHGFKVHGFAKLENVGETGLSLIGVGDDESGESRDDNQEFIGSSFPPGTEIRAYFSYYGHVMTFVSTVSSVSGATIILDFPQKIYRDLARKYERVVAPEGVSVTFEIEHKKVTLDYPVTEEYEEVEEPHISEGFDPQNLGSLINSLKTRTSDRASTCSVVMFREREPNTFEEKIISQTGKILFLPDTSGQLSETDIQLSDKVISRAMLMQPERIIVDGENIGDLFPKLLSKKKEGGIRGEIFCPIIFHEYAVGYVYLAQTSETVERFDNDLLQMVYQFTKILSYSLKINGYFGEDALVRNRYEGEIIDISASGLLFANASVQVGEVLMLYSDIELLIKFGPRVLRIGARVMRKYQDLSTHYYGIQFIDLKPEDFRFLFDFVYGRGHTTEDDQYWEGGSEPPQLNLE